MYLRTCECFKSVIRAQVRKLQNHTLQIRNHKKRLGQQQQQNLFLRQKYFGSVLFYDVPILCHKLEAENNSYWMLIVFYVTCFRSVGKILNLTAKSDL